MTQTMPNTFPTAMDGPDLLEFLQQIYDSILSSHSGASMPSYLAEYGVFYDTTAGTFKVRKGLTSESLIDAVGAPAYSADFAAGWRLLGDSLECWGSVNSTDSGVGVAFPKTFKTSPVVTTSVQTITIGDIATFQSLSGTGLYVQAATAAGAAVNRVVHWHAIGEWDGIS